MGSLLRVNANALFYQRDAAPLHEAAVHRLPCMERDFDEATSRRSKVGSPGNGAYYALCPFVVIKGPPPPPRWDSGKFSRLATTENFQGGACGLSDTPASKMRARPRAALDGDGELLVRASAVLKSQGPENWSRGRPGNACGAISRTSGPRVRPGIRMA